RSQDKLERARALGLTEGVMVAREQPRFASAILERTGGRAADVVLDFVGGSYLGENLGVLGDRGRLIVIGLLGGASGSLDLATILRKRIAVIGTVLRSRPLDQKIVATRAFATDVLPLFERGAVAPVIDRTFSFAEVARAHEYMEKNENFGKIVLLP